MSTPAVQVAVCARPATCAGRKAVRGPAALLLPGARLAAPGVGHRSLGARLGSRAAGPSRRQPAPALRATEGGGGPAGETGFGYTRLDVILIGVGIVAFGVAAFFALEAAGVESRLAGNFVQFFVVIAMTIGWIGSYLFRVANKDMTYAKQLKTYEEAVMAKRLEEMPDSEIEALIGEVDTEKKRLADKRSANGGGQ